MDNESRYNELLAYKCYTINISDNKVTFQGYATNYRMARRLASRERRGFWGRWFFSKRNQEERQNFYLHCADIGKVDMVAGYIVRVYGAQGTNYRKAS
jgi:hypothetical protein